MSDDNPRSNVERGEAFEQLTRRQLEAALGMTLDSEIGLGIGNPPKLHRFDLVSVAEMVAIECKAFTWTRPGNNVSSAKITTAREALLYHQWLPAGWKKILPMAEATRPTHQETLAEYFVRLHAHLLGDVSVVEVEEGGIRVVAGSLEF